MPRIGFITSFFVFLLSACGGGGGSAGNSGSTPNAAPAVTFRPARMDLAYTAGDSISFDIDTQASASINGNVYVQIIDSAGVITTDFSLQGMSARSYVATLHTSPSVGAGHYTGNLQVKICKDSGCASQWPGSPVLFPYDFWVYAPSDLRTLSQSTSAADWETLRGNTAHSGYVDITLDASNISQRWQWNAPYYLTPAAVADGIVYVGSSNNDPAYQGGYSPGTLFAINEADGGIAWQHDFGSVAMVAPPGISGNKVVVSSSAYDSGTSNWVPSTWAFSGNDGTQQFQLPVSGSFNYPPMIDGGDVYIDMDEAFSTTLSRRDGATGNEKWSVSGNQYDGLPALDSNYAYFSNDTLRAYNKADGTAAFSISDPGCCSGPVTPSDFPVLTSNNSVLAVRERGYTLGALNDFDLGSQSIKWSVSGEFDSMPAFANDVVYVLRNMGWPVLEARRESDGVLLWSWTGSLDDLEPGDDLIITNNMAIFSTLHRIHAVSLVTHESIWTFAKTGRLALSANGVLYIATTGKTLYAINMK